VPPPGRFTGPGVNGATPPPAQATPPLRADAGLQARLAARLRGFTVRPIAAADRRTLRHAAVAIVVTEAGHGAGLPGLATHADWSTEAALVLTRRHAGLRRHAGQWALPGGRIDAGESPEQAALRELAEEVGLVLPPDAVLGRLDDYATRSGYLITPVVAWAGAARGMVANPQEVDSIHRIPVREFLRPDGPMLETTSQGPEPVLRMPVGEQWIAAPTAALIYQFREVAVLGRDTRVAHFDQPAFAWT
jgi:8-oxo-dGTP pyrophosphatase MutT (NUDIX family)